MLLCNRLTIVIAAALCHGIAGIRRRDIGEYTLVSAQVENTIQSHSLHGKPKANHPGIPSHGGHGNHTNSSQGALHDELKNSQHNHEASHDSHDAHGGSVHEQHHDIKITTIHAELTDKRLDAWRQKGACIVVSANTKLLSCAERCTGIAAKVFRLGGENLVDASNEELKHQGGQVPVGKAAFSAGGGFKGVVYAVTMAYKNGQRVPATYDTVQSSFHAGLKEAEKHGCHIIVTPVLSARAGYSVYPEKEAKTEMYEAMRHAVSAMHDTAHIKEVHIYMGGGFKSGEHH